MALQAGQELLIDNVSYRIAAHPTLPNFPFGQEGRAAVVYQLLADNGQTATALKVLKARYRQPSMVWLAAKVARLAELPGLSVCSRTVLIPQKHRTILQADPELVYSVLMPWINGPTWMETMLNKAEFSALVSLKLARSLAVVLATMEQHGIAHCDLSGPNLLLPSLVSPKGASEQTGGLELVDVEQLYAPGLERPETVAAGSPGYAHRTAGAGLWAPDADRFAGAVLLAELLAWCDPQVREAAWGESYFDPDELPRRGTSGQGERFQLLTSTLRQRWGNKVAGLLDQAWQSETLADCPTFGDWLTNLPEPFQAESAPLPPASDPLAIQALVDQACQLEEEGRLVEALQAYRQALEMAPLVEGLASELQLIIDELSAQVQAEQTAPPVESAPAVPLPSQPSAGDALDPLLARASQLEEEGRTTEAADLYRQARQLAPPESSLAAELDLIIRQVSAIIQVEPAQPESLETLSPVAIAMPMPVREAPSRRRTQPILPENAQNLRVIGALPGRVSPLGDLTFTGGGGLLAVGLQTGLIRLFDPDNWSLRTELRGNARPITALASSGDGQLLAAGYRDGAVQVWQMPHGTPLRVWQNHRRPVTVLAISPHGDTVASASSEGLVHVYSPHAEFPVRSMEAEGAVFALAGSPDGRLLVSGGAGGAMLWRLATGGVLRTLRGHLVFIGGVAFSPDAGLVATAAADNTVRIWRMSDGKPVRVLRGHTAQVTAVAFSPDGEVLATGSADRTVKFWHTAEGTLIRTLKAHLHPVVAVSFSPDGTVLASGSYEGVRLWGVP